MTACMFLGGDPDRPAVNTAVDALVLRLSFLKQFLDVQPPADVLIKRREILLKSLRTPIAKVCHER